MEGDRVHADVLSAGDFLIAQPARHQLADRSLGVGQARPADVRPPMSRPVPPPHPCLAQPPPDPDSGLQWRVSYAPCLRWIVSSTRGLGSAAGARAGPPAAARPLGRIISVGMDAALKRG